MYTDEFNSDEGDHLMSEIKSDIEEEDEQQIFDKNDLLNESEIDLCDDEDDKEIKEESEVEEKNELEESDEDREKEDEEESYVNRDKEDEEESDHSDEDSFDERYDENNRLEENYLNKKSNDKHKRDLDCDSLIDGDDLLNSSSYSDTSEEDEMILNESINSNLRPDSVNIYENSCITVAEFRLSLLLLQQKINLSPANTKLVFEFVKALLPKDNNLTSYRKLIGDFKCEKSSSTKACLICCRPLLLKECCDKRSCIVKKNTKELIKYKDLLCVKFDFRKHLEYVVVEKWENILSYQGN
jgi:hypothetical protein